MFYTTTNTTEEVTNIFADVVSSNLGYSKAAFLAGMNDPNLNELARIHWKYACSRYTTGTPHFLVNGIPVDDQLPNGSLQDWEALIDPLLPSADGEKAAPKKQQKKRGSNKKVVA